MRCVFICIITPKPFSFGTELYERWNNNTSFLLYIQLPNQGEWKLLAHMINPHIIPWIKFDPFCLHWSCSPQWSRLQLDNSRGSNSDECKMAQIWSNNSLWWCLSACRWSSGLLFSLFDWCRLVSDWFRLVLLKPSSITIVTKYFIPCTYRHVKARLWYEDVSDTIQSPSLVSSISAPNSKRRKQIIMRRRIDCEWPNCKKMEVQEF